MRGDTERWKGEYIPQKGDGTDASSTTFTTQAQHFASRISTASWVNKTAKATEKVESQHKVILQVLKTMQMADNKQKNMNMDVKKGQQRIEEAIIQMNRGIWQGCKTEPAAKDINETFHQK